MNEDRQRAEEPASVSAKEFLTVQRGDGSPADCERVRAALEDPRSELNRWLIGVENWARTAFGFRGIAASNEVRARLNSRPAEIRQSVERFVSDKRESGELSAEDASRILSRAALPDNNADGTSVPTPADHLAAAAAMIQDLIAVQPEWASDLRRVDRPNDR